MLFKSTLVSLLAAVASAMPIEDYRRTLDMIDSRALAISEADLDTLRFFVQYAGASYCNNQNAPGDAITCGSDACPDVQATTLTSFRGGDTGIEGFVSRDDSRRLIVLSIRGSNEILNWITNIDFLLTNCDPLVHGCQTHSGFTRAWNGIRGVVVDAIRAARQANPDYTVVATGHSLGAAVATIAAAYLRAQEGIPVDLYSYGAPRAGNGQFADFVSRQPGANWRLTHGADPVPRLPPIIFGYRHTSPEHWLNGGASDFHDYNPGQVSVCEGSANIRCNGGTFGLDITAHLHYLRETSACSPKGLKSFQATETDAATDVVEVQETPELEEKVNDWVQQDIDFVNGNTS